MPLDGTLFSTPSKGKTLITQKTVNGTVRLKLYKGNCIPVGRKSDQSLYQESFATFEEDQVFDQGDATGFIRLNGLRLKINALQDRFKK